MWVLLIFASLNTAAGGAPVPGYKTEAGCEDAGRFYVNRALSRGGKMGSFLCIPGPLQPDRADSAARWVGEVTR